MPIFGRRRRHSQAFLRLDNAAAVLLGSGIIPPSLATFLVSTEASEHRSVPLRTSCSISRRFSCLPCGGGLTMCSDCNQPRSEDSSLLISVSEYCNPVLRRWKQVLFC